MTPDPLREDLVGVRVELGPRRDGVYESSWTRIDHGRTGTILGLKALAGHGQVRTYLVFRPDEPLKRDGAPTWYVAAAQVYPLEG